MIYVHLSKVYTVTELGSLHRVGFLPSTLVFDKYGTCTPAGNSRTVSNWQRIRLGTPTRRKNVSNKSR